MKLLTEDELKEAHAIANENTFSRWVWDTKMIDRANELMGPLVHMSRLALRYRKALEFYADESMWYKGTPEIRPGEYDDGETARKALEEDGK